MNIAWLNLDQSSTYFTRNVSLSEEGRSKGDLSKEGSIGADGLSDANIKSKQYRLG